MTHMADVIIQDNTIYVTGDVHYQSAMSLFEKTIARINPHKPIYIDFSKVTSTNSVIIALMIEWLRLAKQNKQKIQFYHIPDNVVAIAKNADLAELLGL